MTRRKMARHGLRMFTEPHRLRAYFFYKTHPHHPLFTPAATQFLLDYLKPGMHVFEWGAGRSTPFFAQRQVTLISIENDPVWHQWVRRQLGRYKPAPVDLKLIESLPNYIAAIESCPDNHFDIVTVDGREREACLLTALPKVKSGGLVLLDDSQRERYQSTMAEVEKQGWTPQHFPYGFNRTTIWTKPL